MVETLSQRPPEVPPEPRPPRGRRVVAVVITLLAMLGALALGARALMGELRRAVAELPEGESGRQVEPGQAVQVVVPAGASARAIGELLAAEGVIDSPLRFEIAVRTSGAAARLQAGTYRLETGMEEEAALEVLLAGPVVETFWVTVVEGLWVEEIVQSLARQTEFSEEDYRQVLVEGRVESELLPEEPDELRDWEGLLFPDTYQFELEGVTPQRILQRMADTMERRVEGIDWARLEELGVSRYQAIIVASLVEAETRIDDERSLVASVVYNRLDQGIALEIDATVLYAVGKRGSGPTASDLEVDSPYNTRRFPGLPPTPIGAPGLASLQAAADPADTDYLYYVLVDRSGRHGFTASYDEFLQMKRQAQEDGIIP